MEVSPWSRTVSGRKPARPRRRVGEAFPASFAYGTELVRDHVAAGLWGDHSADLKPRGPTHDDAP